MRFADLSVKAALLSRRVFIFTALDFPFYLLKGTYPCPKLPSRKLSWPILEG
jgi:hypothetical protein